MASRQYSTGQPNLPARNQQSNVIHVKMGQISNQSNNGLQNCGRSQPLDTPPAVLRRSSEGAVRHAHDAVPPLPNRSAPHGAPLRRQSFETHSFIDRNSAKAFSDPKGGKQAATYSGNTTTHQGAVHSSAPGSQGSPAIHAATVPRNFHIHDDAPPRPPTSRPPARHPTSHETSPPAPAPNPPQRKQQPNQDPVASPPPRMSHPPSRRQQSLPVSEVPPELPPSRPPKTSLRSTSIDAESAPGPARPPKSRLHSVTSANEFEEQYRFHEPNEFPLPNTSKISTSKTYPSRADSVKRKSGFEVRDDKLGPL